MGRSAAVAPATRCLPHRAAWSGSLLTQAAHAFRCPCSFLPESNWGANAGLAVARDLLEPVKQKVRRLYGITAHHELCCSAVVCGLRQEMGRAAMQCTHVFSWLPRRLLAPCRPKHARSLASLVT